MRGMEASPVPGQRFMDPLHQAPEEQPERSPSCSGSPSSLLCGAAHLEEELAHARLQLQEQLADDALPRRALCHLLLLLLPPLRDARHRNAPQGVGLVPPLHDPKEVLLHTRASHPCLTPPRHAPATSCPRSATQLQLEHLERPASGFRRQPPLLASATIPDSKMVLYQPREWFSDGGYPDARGMEQGTLTGFPPCPLPFWGPLRGHIRGGAGSTRQGLVPGSH